MNTEPAADTTADEAAKPVIEGDVMHPDRSLIAAPQMRERAIIERGRDMDATTFEGVNAVFSNGIAFQLACKMAAMLASSTILPEAYRDNPSNCLVAIDYAARLGVSPVMLAQNMDVVKGRPGLRGTFLAGIINACPMFSRLKYEWRGTDKPGGEPSQDFGCRAYATEIATGETLVGSWIDWRMAKAEGWDSNKKWTSLREQMFMYRAAAFWSRAHASDVTLGLYESEELHDAEKDYGPARGVATKAATSKDAVADMAATLAKRKAPQVDKDTGEVLPDELQN